LAMENEKLIAKIQLEYTSGKSIDIAKAITDWDIGLLYFTNKNLWFINSKKERTQIEFPHIIDVDAVKPRTAQKKTKFTKVLEASHLLNIDFRAVIDENPMILTVQLSAAKEILSAIKNQLIIRLEQKTKHKAGEHKLDKNELLRRLAVLLQINIKEEDKLRYFLGVKDRELVNLMLERTRILQKAS